MLAKMYSNVVCVKWSYGLDNCRVIFNNINYNLSNKFILLYQGIKTVALFSLNVSLLNEIFHAKYGAIEVSLESLHTRGEFRLTLDVM